MTRGKQAKLKRATKREIKRIEEHKTKHPNDKQVKVKPKAK